jgi:hypothetical protein
MLVEIPLSREPIRPCAKCHCISWPRYVLVMSWPNAALSTCDGGLGAGAGDTALSAYVCV